jgi:hypothetical protein
MLEIEHNSLFALANITSSSHLQLFFAFLSILNLQLSQLSLDLSLHKFNNSINFIIKPVLQFLVVTSALIWCSFMKLFRKPIKDDTSASDLLRDEIPPVFG